MSSTSLELNEENFEAKSLELVDEISQRVIPLVKVVEDLGPLLTDKVVARRKLGLQYLTKILTSLDVDFLNEDECKFLSVFYQDRMRDHHDLMPGVIEGMESLVCMKNLSADDLSKLLRSAFNEIHVQSQMLSERRRIFCMHRYLLTMKLPQVTPLGMDYLLGFIQAVDEEKDPNNLMSIFNCWPIIIDNFELEPLTEDAFETLACYFPIDFSPPAGMYGSVTKDDLILALRRCLASSAVFAPRSIPLFLEKLSSDLSDAKIDSAMSLQVCLSVCDPSHADLFLEQVWNQLKHEIMGVRLQTNERVVEACLDVLTSATKRLSSVVQTPENRSILTKWVETIWTDCGRHLRDLELKFMTSTVDIFSAVLASGADFPAVYILDRAMPILVELFHSRKTDVQSSVSVLHFVSKLLSNAPQPATTPDWYERFLFICTFSLSVDKEPSLEDAAHVAVTHGIGFLKLEHAEQVFLSLFEKVCTGKVPNHKMLKCFDALQLKCDRPSKDDLSRLFVVLSEHPESALPLLKLVSTKDKYLSMLYPQLEAWLSDSDVEHFSWSLHIMKQIWAAHQNLDHFVGEQVILERVITQALSFESCPAETEANILELISDISRHLNSSNADWIEATCSMLLGRYTEIQSQLVFKLIEGLICFPKPEVLSQLSSNLFAQLLGAKRSSDAVNLSCSKIFSAILNKLPQPEKAAGDLLSDSAKTPYTRLSVIQVSWIFRALLLRNHLLLKKSLDVIANILSSDCSDISNFMAMNFAEAVANKNGDFLIENVTLSGLARQKVFALTKPRFLAAYKAGKNSGAHLKSIICQFDFLPKFSLVSEFNDLIPLLAKGLESEDGDLVLGLLVALKDLFKQDPNSFSSVLTTFFPIWIRLSTSKDRHMKVRIAALQCIKESCQCDQPEVVKLKRDVMRQLLPALDDHKRLVRCEAVAARNAWALKA